MELMVFHFKRWKYKLQTNHANSNNFTLAGGTLTNTEDCPSNVFATLNPLYQQTTGEGVVLMNGNTRCYYSLTSSSSAFGTSKYYWKILL